MEPSGKAQEPPPYTDCPPPAYDVYPPPNQPMTTGPGGVPLPPPPYNPGFQGPSSVPEPQFGPYPTGPPAVIPLLPQQQGGQRTHQHTVIINQPVTVITATVVGPFPSQMPCAKCATMVTSRTYPIAGCLAWVLCLLILFMGCWAGCCLIPFCIPSLQNVEHRCPNCKTLLGVYQSCGRAERYR